MRVSSVPGNRVGHPSHQRQERQCQRWHDQALDISQLCGCQELGEPSLQHADAEKRWLQTRTTVADLGNFEQQRSVRVGVAEGADDSIIAIHFDRITALL